MRTAWGLLLLGSLAVAGDERLVVLRKAVEAEIGAVFGALPKIVEAKAGELEALLEREGVERPADAARVVCMRADPAGRRILIARGAFARIAALDPTWSKIDTTAVREAALLLELARIGQMAPAEREHFLSVPAPRREARRRLLAGHARFVARRAAARLDLADAFELLLEPRTGLTPGLSEAGVEQVRLAEGCGLGRADEEGEAFFAAIHKELGANAWPRLRDRPPERTALFAAPRDHLEALGASIDIGRAARAIRRLLTETRTNVSVHPMTQFFRRQVLEAAGGDALALYGKHFRRGSIVRAVEPATRVEIHQAHDADGARELLALQEVYEKWEDTVTVRANGQLAIDARKPESIEVDGVAVVLRQRGMTVGGFVNNRSLVLYARVDDLLVRLLVLGEELDRDEVVRAFRGILALLRGQVGRSPWEGKQRGALIEAMAAALSDPRWDVRWRAARNLARVRGHNVTIDAALAGRLADEEPEVRIATIRALAKRGWIRPIREEAYRKVESDPDERVRSAYFQLFTEEATAHEAVRVSVLRRGLADPAAVVRRSAVRSIEEMRKGRLISWPEYERLLADPDAVVREVAIDMLPRSVVRKHRKKATPLLLAALRDENDDVRSEAAYAISPLVRQREVVKALVDALEDKDYSVQSGSAYALRDADPDLLAPFLPKLVRALSTHWICDDVARILGKLGPRAKEAVPALRKQLEDDSAGNRCEAVLALVRIGEEAAPLIATLHEALKEGDRWDQRRAARAIREIGAPAAPCVPTLIGILDNRETNPSLQRACVEALGGIGPAAKESLPTLERLAAAAPPPSDELGLGHADGLLDRKSIEKAIAAIRKR